MNSEGLKRPQSKISLEWAQRRTWAGGCGRKVGQPGLLPSRHLAFPIHKLWMVTDALASSIQKS